MKIKKGFQLDWKINAIQSVVNITNYVSLTQSKVIHTHLLQIIFLIVACHLSPEPLSQKQAKMK